MSKRNSHSGKARRRADRALKDALALTGMTTYDELVGQAMRGETLPCGCDAHEVLHEAGWQMINGSDT